MDKKKHIKYIQRCQALLPHQYTSEDLNHMALANFTISSLDLLDSLPSDAECQRHIAWIYQHYLPCGRGFRGSLHAQLLNSDARFDPPHLPATYFAVMSLLVLGDDLKRIDAAQIMSELKARQNVDGSFTSNRLDRGIDVRFSYMVIAVRHVLMLRGHRPNKDISTYDALKFLKECRQVDGGYGQHPGAESHSGLTFCALAARVLLQDEMQDDRFVTINWLVHRHNADGGFNGRIGKDSDVCYCFWNISSLALLDAIHLVDQAAVVTFLSTCQTIVGGYGKSVGDMPDLFHSYVGIAVQNLLKQDGPDKECCALSVTKRALQPLRDHRV